MALVQMQKVAILGYKGLREDMIAALHEIGMVQVEQSEEGTKEDHTEMNFHMAELTFAINVLREHASKDTQRVAARASTPEEITHATLHTDIRNIIDTLHERERIDTEANRGIQERELLLSSLVSWKNLQPRLDASYESETTLRILGTMPVKNEANVQDILNVQHPRTVLLRIGGEKELGTYEAIVWKSDREAFEEIVTTHGWTSESLPEKHVTAAEYIEEATAEIRELQKEIAQSAAMREKLSVELPNLMKAHTYLRWIHEKQEVRDATAETEKTFTILGWMAKSKLEELERKLQKISPAITILKVKPDEGEEPPVLLKNPKFVAPFESVTNLYGLPLPAEMDPTKALSPFFILYFALCLTDAGYGLILTLIFGAVLLKSRKSMQEAKLIWLLFFGGVTTFLVSIPFGGWLGFTPEQVPAFLTKQTPEGLLFRGQIWNLNAQSGIDFLQNLSLFLGVTHLFFGMFLAGWHKWIHGKKVEALWMDFTAHILLGTIIIYVLYSTPQTLYLLYGAIALLVWGKGYGSAWYLRPLIGLIGLLNFVIGMISNVLSYLRILALGLVTGALAAAVNMVAVEMGNLFPPVIGIPVVIAIFLVGHLVSIALNTLGSFIHSGRLQFIEFFSQFFEGGGQGFTPFKRTTT